MVLHTPGERRCAGWASRRGVQGGSGFRGLLPPELYQRFSIRAMAVVWDCDSVSFMGGRGHPGIEQWCVPSAPHFRQRIVVLGSLGIACNLPFDVDTQPWQ